MLAHATRWFYIRKDCRAFSNTSLCLLFFQYVSFSSRSVVYFSFVYSLHRIAMPYTIIIIGDKQSHFIHSCIVCVYMRLLFPINLSFSVLLGFVKFSTYIYTVCYQGEWVISSHFRVSWIWKQIEIYAYFVSFFFIVPYDHYRYRIHRFKGSTPTYFHHWKMRVSILFTA